MQTNSSDTLIGWKSGKTTYFALSEPMEGAWLWTQHVGICQEDKKRLRRHLIFDRDSNELLENKGSNIFLLRHLPVC
jgi:hypothetical protein